LVLERRLTELGALVDEWSRQELASALSVQAVRLGGMLEYHLGWRDEHLELLPVPAPAGKKLRPALTLLVCEGVSGRVEPARAAAVAIELVHNFSLVHDDIQDRSALRRHRPAVWARWGLEQGINIGDALFALAQLALLRQPADVAARMLVELNATCVRLVEGQFLDIELQRGTIEATPQTYRAMVARKTGALFASACRLGAIAGEAPPEVTDAYGDFGLELGFAFQEQDDLLGVWGHTEKTGKPRAADVVERKRGLPAMVALSRADAPGWLRDAYASTNGSMPRKLVERVIAHFDGLNLRAELTGQVEQHARRALAALEAAAPHEPARSYLAELTSLVVSRSA
jgi:geranylgeranyl diphosphate synthase type I